MLCFLFVCLHLLYKNKCSKITHLRMYTKLSFLFIYFVYFNLNCFYCCSCVCCLANLYLQPCYLKAYISHVTLCCLANLYLQACYLKAYISHVTLSYDVGCEAKSVSIIKSKQIYSIDVKIMLFIHTLLKTS